jgi:cobalt-zinc-cadmium efflux system protein
MEVGLVPKHDHHKHQHGHAHGHAVGQVRAAPLGRNTAMTWAVALTAGYAGVEFVTGMLFGSLALVSDAGHMISDSLALGLAWFAAWLARRPAGARHSYGLARAEVIAAFLNGLAMVLVVVLISVEAIARLLDPQPVQGLGVMVVAFVGLLVNLVVALILSRGEQTLNSRAALLHVTSDVIGSVAALLAGAVIYATGWAPIDPILSLVISLLILASTINLLRETLHVLMEGVPSAIDLKEVGRALAALEHVTNAHDLHIWNISSGQVALSAHLELGSLSHWPKILTQARGMLSDRFGIEHVTLQPELSGAPRPGHAVVKMVARR